jgi:hypothetical protein
MRPGTIVLWLVAGLQAACGSSSESKGGTADGGLDSGGSGAAGGSGGAGGASGAGGSSGGAGGAGGGGNADCTTACDALERANCPNAQPRALCLADCGAAANACPAELRPFASCVSTTGMISCDADGFATVTGCDASFTRLSGCSACLPGSTDDACDSCQKLSCCPQLYALLGASDSLDFARCLGECTTTACITTCQSQFPTAGGAFDALSQCIEASCLSTCS